MIDRGELASQPASPSKPGGGGREGTHRLETENRQTSGWANGVVVRIGESFQRRGPGRVYVRTACLTHPTAARRGESRRRC